MQYELLNTELPRADTAPRSDGLHVSTIINSICVNLNHYQPSDPDTDDPINLWEFGLLFEEVIKLRLQRKHPNEFTNIGELHVDNIYLTPDLVQITDSELQPHEIKLTYMSSKRGLEDDKLWKYLTQLKAYCYALQSLTGYLHILYINGDYRNDKPIYHPYKITFSRQEILENWLTLKSHANRYLNYEL